MAKNINQLLDLNAMKFYDWSQLTPSKKKALTAKKAILILGSREISAKKIAQLASGLTKQSFLIFGQLKEKFIDGFEGCPQFKTLKLNDLEASLETLPAEIQNKVAILSYRQTEAKYLLRELNLTVVIIVRGSYQYAFHYTPLFYEINKKKLEYRLINPFINKAEAQNYEEKIKKLLLPLEAVSGQKYSDDQLLKFAQKAGKFSFDYTFQTGAVLAKDNQFLLASHNVIVPFETAMLHFGASKEQHFGPPQDLNFYDTNHAEVELILQAAREKLDLTGTTLYINLMPCPICARMLARSPIKKVVYQLDHSDGYAFKLLRQAGKEVERKS